MAFIESRYGTYFYLLCVASLTAVLLYLSKRAFFGPLSKVPGPFVARWTRYYLAYQILSGNRMQYIDSLHRKYGPVVRVSPLEVAINDPAGVRSIQKTSGGFDKGPWYDKTGPGMLGMRDRSKHSRRRRLLAHPLSNTSLAAMEPLIQRKIDLAMTKVAFEAKERGAADIYKWFSLMATDIIGDLTFGSSFQMLERGEKNQYVLDLQAVMADVHKRAELSPFFGILSYVPLKQTKEFGSRLARITLYGRQSLERLNSALDSGKLDSPIFFSKILQATQTENRLTNRELEEEAVEFMVTGTDTTSNTLTYLVWAVLKHPSVRVNLEKELAHLPDDYTDSDLVKLSYLDCVIKEALRLHGTASGSHERSIPAGGWSICGYYLPDYAVVTTAAYSLHRRADIFEDPFSFRPERWMETTSEMQDCYIPFGGGPRICIGIHLAYMELRLTIAAFFRRFNGASIDPQTTDESMHMENYTLIAPKAERCMIRVHSPKS
ncbi:hypothetical protein ACN47E_003301 [Coniothyrium glycines]